MIFVRNIIFVRIRRNTMKLVACLIKCACIHGILVREFSLQAVSTNILNFPNFPACYVTFLSPHLSTSCLNISGDIYQRNDTRKFYKKINYKKPNVTSSNIRKVRKEFIMSFNFKNTAQVLLRGGHSKP